MATKPWTKAQAVNNKKFQAKLDRLTNYLVKGDWHGSFGSLTEAKGDNITNFAETKSTLPFLTLDFSRMEDGALKVEATYIDASGNPATEEYIAGIQPLTNSLYMVSTGIAEDIALGDISRRSGVINLSFLEPPGPNDRGFVGIFQYTDLSSL